MGAASGRISNIKARSARLELSQRAPFPCLVISDIVMENCFSLSPHSFCFHVYLAFAPKILLHGSPVHVGLLYAENDGQKGPCCRKVLHELQTRPLFRLIYCIYAINAVRAQAEPEGHKNCLLRIFSLQAYTPPYTAEPLPRQPTFLLAFGFLEKKNCKATFKVREMGREHTELGKVAACSLGLS